MPRNTWLEAQNKENIHIRAFENSIVINDLKSCYKNAIKYAKKGKSVNKRASQKEPLACSALWWPVGGKVRQWLQTRQARALIYKTSERVSSAGAGFCRFSRASRHQHQFSHSTRVTTYRPIKENNPKKHVFRRTTVREMQEETSDLDAAME